MSKTVSKKRRIKRTTRPKIPVNEQLKLWVSAGGRCEFRGCNTFLHRDGLTLKETNYSEIAHIVGASRNGPRGEDPLPLNHRHKFENLLLLCKNHHKLIDSKEHEREYPKSLLLSMKNEHEARIARVTALTPGNKTFVVRLRAKIGKDPVAIEKGDIYSAIDPRYPDDRELEIDLTGTTGTDTPSYWATGSETISGEVSAALARRVSNNQIDHLSIFAFAPIPFLMLLGHCLGSKIPYDVFQRHRDTQNWTWKRKGPKVKFASRLVSKGKDTARVGLKLSLSGSVEMSDLPADAQTDYPLYELKLASARPNPTFLRTRQDLADFKTAFLSVLSRIRKRYPQHRELHIFPAVPVSVAVVVGIERLPKVHSPFVVYDYNRSDSKFIRTLTLR